MTYTPGPWEAENGGGKGAWIKGSDGHWSALSCGPDDEVAMANAKLISAAPELLSLMKEVLSDLEIGAHPHLHIYEMQDLIAKAEGRSNGS